MEEIKVLNSLDHPNIVNYFETYDDNRYIYLVMELVKGETLNVFNKNGRIKKFSEEEAAKHMF